MYRNAHNGPLSLFSLLWLGMTYLKLNVGEEGGGTPPPGGDETPPPGDTKSIAGGAGDGKGTPPPGDKGAPPPAEPTADEMKAALVEKGGKAEDLDKLSADDLKKQFGELKALDAPVDKPEGYKDFQFPDGVEVDRTKLDQFKAVAAKAKLSQNSAQELVGLYTGLAKEAAEASSKLWEKTQGEWKAQVQKDPEIGGNKFAEMQTHVATALKEIGGEHEQALREALDMTGAGNHPAVVRAFYRLGKLFSEGGPTAPGKGAAPTEKLTAAQVLYPSQQGQT